MQANFFSGVAQRVVAGLVPASVMAARVPKVRLPSSGSGSTSLFGRVGQEVRHTRALRAAVLRRAVRGSRPNQAACLARAHGVWASRLPTTKAASYPGSKGLSAFLCPAPRRSACGLHALRHHRRRRSAPTPATLRLRLQTPRHVSPHMPFLAGTASTKGLLLLVTQRPNPSLHRTRLRRAGELER